jgi:hypothetical protein
MNARECQEAEAAAAMPEVTLSGGIRVREPGKRQQHGNGQQGDN